MELLENIVIACFILGLIIIAAKYIPKIKIAKVCKIPISITSAFVFFIGFIALVGGWIDVLRILTMYFIVVLHELSHSITAQKLGYTVKSIDLWPMSGLATIDGDFTKNAWHEFIIALNGPLLNLVLAAGLSPFLLFHNQIVAFLFEINICLALFNLIPIYPMDGGRLLHAFYVWKIKDEDRVANWMLCSTLVIGSITMPLVWMFWQPFAACMVGFMMGVGLLELLEHYGRKIVKARKRLDELISGEKTHLLKLVNEIRDLLQNQLQYFATKDDPSGGIAVIQLERQVGIAEREIIAGYIKDDFAKMQEARSRLLDVLGSMRELIK
jgi:Zn-dependent protease